MPQSVQLKAISVSNLDTTFHAIIRNHLCEMKTNGLYNPLDSFIIIYINPYLSNSSGVPQGIIDSIYRTNIFPINSGSQSYKFVVVSLAADCQVFNSIINYKYRFYSKIDNYTVLILSMLKIEFGKCNDEISISICPHGHCDKLCIDNLEKTTTYIVHADEIIQAKYFDIWLRNNKLINHPRKSN